MTQHLQSGSAKARLYAQYELLQRPEKEAGEAAWNIAENKQLPLDIRVAGIFTYAQIAGEKGVEHLVKLTKDSAVKEFALRTLADRKPYIDQVPIEPFLSALDSPSNRVKIAAIVGLGQLGRRQAVPDLLDIPVPPSFKTPEMGTEGPYATPNPEIIPAHVAVKALVEIGTKKALLNAVEADQNPLALWAVYPRSPRAGTACSYIQE